MNADLATIVMILLFLQIKSLSQIPLLLDSFGFLGGTGQDKTEGEFFSQCLRNPLQDLTHLLLDCPASEPLRCTICTIFGTTSLIFEPWSRPWSVT